MRLPVPGRPGRENRPDRKGAEQKSAANLPSAAPIKWEAALPGSAPVPGGAWRPDARKNTRRSVRRLRAPAKQVTAGGEKIPCPASSLAARRGFMPNREFLCWKGWFKSIFEMRSMKRTHRRQPLHRSSGRRSGRAVRAFCHRQNLGAGAALPPRTLKCRRCVHISSPLGTSLRAPGSCVSGFHRVLLEGNCCRHFCKGFSCMLIGDRAFCHHQCPAMVPDVARNPG